MYLTYFAFFQPKILGPPNAADMFADKLILLYIIYICSYISPSNAPKYVMQTHGAWHMPIWIIFPKKNNLKLELKMHLYIHIIYTHIHIYIYVCTYVKIKAKQETSISHWYKIQHRYLLLFFLFLYWSIIPQR